MEIFKMDTLLKQFADSFLDDYSKQQGYSEKTDELFGEWLTQKSAELVYEDHQYYMNAKEMSKHLKKLLNKCEDEKMEEKFLAKVAKASGVKECTRKDLDKCSETLCKKDEKECDKLIHELEELVGHKEDFTKELKEAKERKKEVVGGGWTKANAGKVAVHLKSGAKGLVLRSDKSSSKGGLDVVVAPLIGGTRPSYRNEKHWGHGTFKLTDQTMKVDPPKPAKQDEDDD